MNLLACIAEDRVGAEIGLKLAILSLNEHCPDVPIILHRPDPIPSFEKWLRRFPQVILKSERFANWHDWNCKPEVLLQAFRERDETQALWLDSDMVITRDPREIWQQVPPETLIVTQEPASQPHQGSECRTTGWGWPVGIRYPHSFNSSVVRTSRRHIRFLERWRELQRDPSYLAASTLPLDQRPIHLLSDQDLMTGMLGSAEFADHPVHMLPHGKDVIHCGGALGFSLMERLQGPVRPLPTFLHAIGGKPWVLMGMNNPASDRGARFRRLLQEVSPYVAYVRRYRDLVDEDVAWMNFKTLPGVILRAAGFGHWALRGLPVTAAATLWRAVRGS